MRSEVIGFVVTVVCVDCLTPPMTIGLLRSTTGRIEYDVLDPPPPPGPPPEEGEELPPEGETGVGATGFPSAKSEK